MYVDKSYLDSQIHNNLLNFLLFYFPDGKTINGEFVVRNYARGDRRAGSFKMNLRSFLWSDFATGEKGRGASSFIACGLGIGFYDALVKIVNDHGLEAQKDGFVGGGGGNAHVAPASDFDIVDSYPHYSKHKNYKKAGLLYKNAKPVLGTPAEEYLLHRHIIPQEIDQMRYDMVYHPDYGYKIPCLLLCVRDIHNKFQAIQRIFINPDNPKKYHDVKGIRKMSCGSLRGGAFKAGINSKHIIVCEGAEDALTILQYGDILFDWVGLNEMPSVWAVLGLSGFLNVAYPDGAFIEIVVDNDVFEDDKKKLSYKNFLKKLSYQKFLKKLSNRMIKRKNDGNGDYKIIRPAGNAKDYNQKIMEICKKDINQSLAYLYKKIPKDVWSLGKRQ